MLRIFFVALVLIGAFFLIQYFRSNPHIQSGLIAKQDKSAKIEETFIFVPYWTVSSDKSLTDYDTLIYFGVAADENGIIEDPGSENVEVFLSKVGHNQKKLLTLRLIDQETNSKILESKASQAEIIEETIDFAKEHGFDGIVIDFETKSIGFQEITDNTANFLSSGLKTIKDSGLEGHTLLFGDTYYRARAFDVKKIAEASDSVMIMAYDFHKSGGNPGPTFPTNGQESYGYDLTKMIENFTSDAAADKIVVILGMFGYDWEVDKNGQAQGVGEALTTGEAEMFFENNCEYVSCTVDYTKDHELKATYTDAEGNMHEAWVETDESAKRKIELIEKAGISKVGYWAYTFF